MGSFVPNHRKASQLFAKLILKLMSKITLKAKLSEIDYRPDILPVSVLYGVGWGRCGIVCYWLGQVWYCLLLAGAGLVLVGNVWGQSGIVWYWLGAVWYCLVLDMASLVLLCIAWGQSGIGLI